MTLDRDRPDEDGDAGPLPAFARIRLYVEAPLRAGEAVGLSDGQVHYLRAVMRLEEGGLVRLFNGRDGEWEARLTKLTKREAEAEPTARLRPHYRPPDILVAFAPVKKAPMAYLVEKATELGAAQLQPVATERCQQRGVNSERMAAQAAEAAEQSFRLDVPVIHEMIPLAKLLADWPDERGLIFCDEGGAMDGGARPALDALSAAKERFATWGLLLGPEGGFSPAEQTLIRAHKSAVPVSLGPRILRAETACVTALTLVQAVLGDLSAAPA